MRRQVRIRLGIVFGGTGPEHEASLSSAKAVFDHLDPRLYEVTQFAIEKTGHWIAGPNAWHALYVDADHHLLPIEIRDLPIKKPTHGIRRLGSHPASRHFANIEVVFPLVHGQGGEDGTLQRLCAQYSKPFVGCGAEASAIGFNKWAAKLVARQNGIPSARGVLIHPTDSDSRIIEIVSEAFGEGRVVVKPSASGSSFGVHAVEGCVDVVSAVHDARRYSEDAIVEEFLDAEEILVGVLGNGEDLTISPPIVHGPGVGKISSYFDKYIDIHSPIRNPTGFGSEIDAAAKDIARNIYIALGCTGFARVDIFFCPSHGNLYLNEVNTIPALAVNDTFPSAMASAGLSFPEMLDRIIQLSLDRHETSSAKSRGVGTSANRRTTSHQRPSSNEISIL
jgi:D-alanine-D-alanine ligase